MGSMLELFLLLIMFAQGRSSSETCAGSAPLTDQIAGHYTGFATWGDGSGIMMSSPGADVWRASVELTKMPNKFWDTYSQRLTLEKDGREIKALARGFRSANSRSTFFRSVELLDTDGKTSFSPGVRAHETVPGSQDSLQVSFAPVSAQHPTDSFLRNSGNSTSSSLCEMTGVLSRVAFPLEELSADDDGLLSPPVETEAAPAFNRGPDMVGKFNFANCEGEASFPGSVLTVSLRKVPNAVYRVQQNALALAIALKSVLETWLYIKQFKVGLSQASLMNTSQWMVGLSVIYDGFEAQYVSSQNSKWWDYRVSSPLAIVSFSKVALICVFQLRWIVLLWKTRAQQPPYETQLADLGVVTGVQGGNTTAQQAVQQAQPQSAPANDDDWMGRLNRRIRWAALVFVLLLVLTSLLTEYIPEAVFIFLSLWLSPQIFRNAYYGSHHPLCVQYVIGISLSRLVLPFYIWVGSPSVVLKSAFIGMPTVGEIPAVGLKSWRGPDWFSTQKIPADAISIFGIIPRRPNAVVFAIIGGLIALQTSYLIVQKLWHPRAFIPTFVCDRFLLHRFDYRLDAVPMYLQKYPEGDGEDCAICLNAVDILHVSATPCRHFFHLECLLQWMETKLECPTCRHALPPW